MAGNMKHIIKFHLLLKYSKNIGESTHNMRILIEHLKNNKEILKTMASAISIAEHKVNLGTAREGLISNFLVQNLPENISYHTGEIFDTNDERSGQIDIILHPISSPKINLYGAISLFPVETVLAGIEVKSVLNGETDINKALSTCMKAKSLEIKSDRNNDENLKEVPFIVFAFTGCMLKTMLKTLEKYSQRKDTSIKDLPDLIVVLDRGYSLWRTESVGDFCNDTYNIYTEDNENETLLTIFYFLLKRIEYWFGTTENSMPIDMYIDIKENRPEKFNLF